MSASFSPNVGSCEASLAAVCSAQSVVAAVTCGGAGGAGPCTCACACVGGGGAGAGAAYVNAPVVAAGLNP